MVGSMDSLMDAVAAAADDGRLTCERAMELADRFSVSPMRVGQAADSSEVRLSACQLGLFGYGADKGKLVKPCETVSEELSASIRSRLVDGKLTCAGAWAMAASSGLSRLAVAEACEALGVKISVCQLGAF